MKWASLALVALLCGCGAAASTAQSGSPAPAPSASVAAAVSPSPSSASVPAAGNSGPVALNCRLPITLLGGDSRKGAFIDFPSGAVTPAPASAGVNSINQPGRELIDQSYALYYDLAYSRWLPVHRSAVAPDGAHYAYTDRPANPPQDTVTRATLHVVDVKTGTEQSFDGGAWADPFVVLDYASEGIYLVTRSNVGIWLLDPVSGYLTRPVVVANVQGYAGNGRFWSGRANPDDPHPINASAPDELDIVNPAEWTRVQWFYRSGSSVHVVAQDGDGHPIIILGTAELNSQELLYLPAAGVSLEVLSGNLPAISDPLADSHGFWFGAPDGIYLYTAQRGLRQVSTTGGLPANGCF